MRSYEAYLAMTVQALETLWQRFGSIPETLRQAMDYTLASGGKRLRPVLLLAACELGGGSAEEALPWACALEMIHSYSLIHDDLPAMDDDDMRRGKPANHVVFGEAMAILAGDGLLSAAMELMLRAAADRADARGTRAALAIARRCGVSGMVAGQTLDMAAEHGRPGEELVRQIHLHKTADLLTAPMEAGLLLAGAPDWALQAGISYGQHLGLAFQIWDDVLDVSGSAEQLGKQVGQDSANGKSTWVALRGEAQARADAAAQAELACAALGPFGDAAALFRRLALHSVSRQN